MNYMTGGTRPGPCLLKLFVYGTLKRGGPNHDRFCANACDVLPATVWGRLYDLPAGFPALQVPRGNLLAHGSADPRSDAGRQQRAGTPKVHTPQGDWDRVQGEIMVFSDPAAAVPPIDELEAFYPGERSLYQRVLVPAETENGSTVVWLYTMGGRVRGRRVTGGIWPAAS